MTVTIREGGYYVTRDGTKVGPIIEDDGAMKTWVWSVEEPKFFGPARAAWRADGSFSPEDANEMHAKDIVAEWVDIPTPQPARGQVWRYRGVSGNFYTNGLRYTVLDLVHGLVFMTDNYAARGYNGAGHSWTPDQVVANFDLVSDTAKPEANADVKAEIADEAKRIVTGARRSAYGAPEQNFERIARFWQAYFDNRGLVLRDANGAPHQITAADVSPMMRLMKEARLCETPDHRDSFVDLVGYALTGAEVNGVAPLDKAPDLS